MDGKQFLEAVMRQLGVTSAQQLANAMDWQRGKERLAAKWISGENRPSYEAVMEMLEKCGWLNMGAAAPKTGTLRRSTGDPLVELRGAVEATLVGVGRIEARLRQVERTLAQGAAQPGAATRGRTRKATGQ